MVDRTRLSLRSLGVRELISELERLRSPDVASAIVFDGDGTLWSGDISEDVFLASVEAELLRDEASSVLSEAARQFDISDAGSASEVAARLFGEYQRGRYPEREICEAMTVCYAGFSLTELRAHARRVLHAGNIGCRLNRALEPIIEWARSEGLRTVVVSASPQPIVEVAAGLWQFAPEDIAASRPALDGERILPRMAGAVPYNVDKCRAGSALIGAADWLASFGDNVFDVDMLETARLGVAVSPKPALRARLPSLNSVVLLAC